MQKLIVTFRCYAELNDFLSRNRRYKNFSKRFDYSASIKDAIESMGVPHSEVDLILVNGKSKSFRYHIKNLDHIAVYPVFESLNISEVSRVRRKPLRKPKFILDVHLGKLARYLRLLGFDTLYQNDYSDRLIVNLAKKERRIILTRDVGLLKNKTVSRGLWLRNTQPIKQTREVLKRLDLYSEIKPFTRCLECNGMIKKVSKKKIQHFLPAKTSLYYQQFFRCKSCQKLYWHGSHYKKLNKVLSGLLK